MSNDERSCSYDLYRVIFAYMFSVLIENKSLKQAVQQVLDIAFGEEIYNGNDLLVTIADEGGMKGVDTSSKQFVVCFVPKLTSSEFAHKEDLEILEYPLNPTYFLRKLELAVKKVTVPDFKKTIQIQGFTFKPDEFLLLSDINNQEIILTEKERNILLLLYSSGIIPVSKDVMLQKIWNYVPDVETHTLETHIYRLRQKIEKDPSAPKILITEENGYRLIY